MKISDLINERKREGKVPFYSFEFFPPKTEEAVFNLKSRIERMVNDLNPLFVDITWGAGGSTSDSTLDIASWIQDYSGTEVMMHLTLTNMPLSKVDNALATAKDKGIKNILALRGDPPRGEETWVASESGFQYAADLVKYIKSNHGDHFGITVAGYPEGHIDCQSKKQDLECLKKKVDEGGEVIITQLFYDVDLFLEFVKDCRAAGIECPIIPGIMPIQSYAGFHRMIGFCKTIVPQQIIDDLEELKHDEHAVKAYGINLAINMCKKMYENGIEGFHFYTLNLERSVRKILEGLDFISSNKNNPWRKVANRPQESVRPIHWSYRSKTYVDRTQNWDDYPNGRWGDSRSPAFGYYRIEPVMTHDKKAKSLEMWGSPVSVSDVGNVFIKFINQEINELPWFEDALLEEMDLIKDLLLLLNQKGLFTLTSQPQMNAYPSNDPKYGWGPHYNNGVYGYIYMKCYVEFFCPPNLIERLIEKFTERPSVAYLAANMNGDKKSNLDEGQVMAVTWGVFPNREIIQPTIVDREVFFNWWTHEAFSIWLTDWGSLYSDESESKALLKSIHDDYWLVTVIENDYVNGNLLGLFEELLNEVQLVKQRFLDQS